MGLLSALRDMLASSAVAAWEPGYYPCIEEASPAQKRSYAWLAEEIRQGRAPNIGGNVSYLFALSYHVIGDFLQDRDYPRLVDWFEKMRAGYSSTEAGSYLDAWQSDAALMVGAWDDAWELRRRSRLDVNYVLTVRSRCSSTTLESQDMRALLLGNNGLTEWGNSHSGELAKLIDRLLAEKHAEHNANVIERFCAQYGAKPLADKDFDAIADSCEYLVGARKLKNAYARSPKPTRVEQILFSGTRLPAAGMNVSRTKERTIRFKAVSPAVELGALAHCRLLLREAENILRRDSGLPAIGQGWVSEAELFRLIEHSFPDAAVRRHAKPRWLAPQHLDVFLPQHNVALEYQGAQHIQPVDYFGGEAALAQQQRRDARKKSLCSKNGCSLIYVFQGYDPDRVVHDVAAAMAANSRPDAP